MASTRSRVCLVAFNKRAQEEMSARVADLAGLQVRTLNAIALAVVNGSKPFAARSTTMTTITEPDVRRLIGKLVEFPRKRNSDPVALWIEALGLARLGLRDPREVEALYDGDVDGFAAVLPRYRQELSRAGVVDYDEQIVRAIEILLTDVAARDAAQRACRVLLVDEFQDLTPAHHLLVRLLAGPDGCVFGVGDDDQTIYGFNGADPQWLIDFAQHFPHAGDHPLEVNYRCPADVVAAAAMLLQHNARRVPKSIRAHTTTTGMVVEDGDDAVAGTVGIVQSALTDGYGTGEIAVLTRVNSLLAPVQIALGGVGVPTHGGVGAEFADRAAVRGSLAWLRLATAKGALSRVDVEEALRNPSRPLRPNIAGWVAEQSALDGLRRLAGRLNTPRRGRAGRGLRRRHRAVAVAGRGRCLDRGDPGQVARLDGDGLDALHARHASTGDEPGSAERRPDRRCPTGAAAARPGGVRVVAARRTASGVAARRCDVGNGASCEGEGMAGGGRSPGRRRSVPAPAGNRRRRGTSGVPCGDHERTIPRARRVRRAPVAVHRSVCSGTGPCCRRGRAGGATATADRAAVAVKPGSDLTPAESTLFEELRAVRRHLAAGKPAYTVLSDQVLHDIARSRPTTLTDLGDIKGMGPVKLERYGNALLAVVETAAAD